MTGAAALGALVTMVAGTEPGVVLGVFLVVGTTAAALAVRPRAVYLIIPVPALAYVVAATLAGLIYDRARDTSLTTLAINAAQWIASGFIAITAATIIAIAATAGRGRMRRERGPRGRGQPPPATRAGRTHRAHVGRRPMGPRRGARLSARRPAQLLPRAGSTGAMRLGLRAYRFRDRRHLGGLPG